MGSASPKYIEGGPPLARRPARASHAAALPAARRSPGHGQAGLPQSLTRVPRRKPATVAKHGAPI